MPITLMASSSSSSSASASIVPFLLRSPTSAPSRSIPNSIRAQISPNPNPNPNKKPLLLLLRLLKPAATATATAAAAAASASLSLSLALALTPTPALAEQMEKAALFDFNLTLPAIALEFLLLMVALDRIYFTPLGNFMQDRDAAIRAQLGDVKDTSGEVKQLEEQSAAVMKAARAEISAALNKMKKETAAELEQKLAQGKSKVEAELAEALADLQRQKEETLSALDSQIRLLADEIVSKVLPPAA